MLMKYTISDKEQWDEVVKCFFNYDVYYLHSYAKGFWLYGDGEPYLFFYKDENIQAMNVVIKRDIAKDPNFLGKIPTNTYFDITTPYGYGGFLIEGQKKEESLKLLNDEYTSFCNAESIVSEFVRFHPVLKNSEDVVSLYDIIDLGKTITLDLSNHKQLWNDMASRNRNVIRKAKKSGVEIYWGRDEFLMEKFGSLYKATMLKDSADDYYFFNNDFYNSMLYDLKYNSLLFYAVYQKQIIAISVILFANGQLHYHLSATDTHFQKLAPTNLLLYEVALWGSINNFKTFHLGGGLGSTEDSVFNFKKAFNKNSATFFSVGKKIFSFDEYEKFIQIRKKEENFKEDTSFFPVYRG